MTKEDRKATISALLEEKRGYQLRALAAEEAGDEDAVALAKMRSAGVDAQLRTLGANAEKPASRAQRRPSQKEASKR
jgi:hypothetical protein